MNERMQVIGFLLDRCDEYRTTIVQLQQRVAELERAATPTPPPPQG